MTTTVQMEKWGESGFMQREAGKAFGIWAGCAENSKGKAFNHLPIPRATLEAGIIAQTRVTLNEGNKRNKVYFVTKD